MKQTIFTAVTILTCITQAVLAEVDLKSSVALQLSRKSASATTHNIDEAWIRGEMALNGKADNGLAGLLQLRSQVLMGDSKVSFTVRQAFFQVPIKAVSVMAGRWYEIYSPGAYFGRWLVENRKEGNGSFCVNYSMLDGIKVTAPIVRQLKTYLQLSFYTEDLYFYNTHVIPMITSNPIEMLTMNLGANIQASDSTATPTHRLMFNATYRILKDFSLFAEYAATNLNDISESSKVLAGIDIPTIGILDLCRVEVEYDNGRPAELSQVGWMVLLMKKAAGLKIHLGVGADPAGLGSTSASEVGFNARITGAF
jgi:hypothetical protein